MEHLNLIESALNVATQKGCFTLQDTANILVALQGLKAQLQPSPQIELPLTDGKKS